MRDELHAAGCDTILEEHASGADRSRPVLARLLREIGPGETLVVVRLDRLARSVSRRRRAAREGSYRRAHLGGTDTVWGAAPGQNRHVQSGAVLTLSRAGGRQVAEASNVRCQSAGSGRSATTRRRP
jgi:hypothetical protein